MKCAVCKTNDAFLDNYYGFLPCESCRENQDKLQKPGKPQEFTTQAIKAQRKEFRRDTIQPYRNGEVSKEYLDQWGSKGIKASRSEIQKAKRVWSGSDAVGYYE